MPETPDNIVPITPDARTAAEKFSAEHARELLTILFTDLVDSTKLQSDLGNVEAARLTELHRKLVRNELAKYDAREIEWAGDSCLAVFTKPSDAVVFALRMQAEHRRQREIEPKLPTVRVGMHLGEIVVKKGDAKTDLFGLQVSEAARVMSVARGNQIFCTRAVFDNARGALKGSAIEGVGDVVWVNYGAYMLKGSEDAVELCEVGSTEVAVLKAPMPSDKVSPLSTLGVGTGHELVPTDPGLTKRQSTALPLWQVIAACAVFLVVGIVLSPLLSTPEVDPSQSQTMDQSAPTAPRLTKSFTMDIGVTDFMEFRPNLAEVAISPDGAHIAYAAEKDGTGRIYLRSINELDTLVLHDTEDARFPFFSPDSQSLAYFSWMEDSMRLVRRPINGDDSRSVCAVTNPERGTWMTNDTFVFADMRSHEESILNLYEVVEHDETPRLLVDIDRDANESHHSSPEAIANTNLFLFTISYDDDRVSVGLFDLDSRSYEVAVPDAEGGVYTSSGHIVFSRDDAFWAVPFDLQSRKRIGQEVQLNLGGDYEMRWQAKPYAVSAEGSLLFSTLPIERAEQRMLVWVDRDGVEITLAIPRAPYEMPRLSPDGASLAVGRSDLDNEDLWMHELDRAGSLMRITFDEGIDRSSVWSADNESIYFVSNRGGGWNINMRPADGSGDVVLVLDRPRIQTPIALVSDTDTLIFMELVTGWDIAELNTGDGTVRMLVNTAFDDAGASVSPDGRFLLYQSNETDMNEVYVRPYPNVDDGKWQVSMNGGEQPMWSHDGEEIFFRSGRSMMSAEVVDSPGNRFRWEPPELLFEGDFYTDEFDSRSYDLEYPDGNRFLMIKQLDPDITTKLVYISNWVDELNSLASAEEVN